MLGESLLLPFDLFKNSVGRIEPAPIQKLVEEICTTLLCLRRYGFEAPAHPMIQLFLAQALDFLRHLIKAPVDSRHSITLPPHSMRAWKVEIPLRIKSGAFREETRRFGDSSEIFLLRLIASAAAFIRRIAAATAVARLHLDGIQRAKVLALAVKAATFHAAANVRIGFHNVQPPEQNLRFRRT